MDLDTDVGEFLASFGDPVLIVDETYTVRDTNRPALDRLGLDRSAVVGATCHEVLHGTADPCAGVEGDCSLRRAIENPPARTTTHVHVDGRGRTARHAVTIARLPSQEDEYAIVLRDVPRETAPDTGQARTFAGFQDAIESAGHGIMITDRSGTIQYVNAGFERITGYSRAEAVGETPHLLSSGQHDKEFYATLWGTILDGRTWRSHIVNRHKNGRLIHVDHTIAPITDGDDIEGFVAVFTEVTGERVRTSQLQVLYRVLRHNLRTETTKIRGFTDLVRQRTDDEAVDEYLAVIERAGETLGDLSDKTQTIRESLRVGDDIDRRADLSRAVDATVTSHGWKGDVTVETPADPVYVNGLLPVAIDELLDNAVEHAGGATVTVERTTRRGEAWVDVVVVDGGPGIPDQERTVLEDGEESPLMHGEGLGLWLAHWAVHLAGGTIAVADRDSAGTAITVACPSLG